MCLNIVYLGIDNRKQSPASGQHDHVSVRSQVRCDQGPSQCLNGPDQFPRHVKLIDISIFDILRPNIAAGLVFFFGRHDMLNAQ